MTGFARFGAAHLTSLLVVGLAAVAAARLGRSERAKPWVRWTLIGVLGCAVLVFYVSEWRRGTLSRLDFLPFHLSDFAVFLAIIALATLRQRAAEFLYFLSLSAILALLTPDLARGFDELRTIVFFVLHGGTVAAACALTFGFGLVPQRGAVLRALAFLNLYALLAAAINLLLGTNFLYLRRKPSQPSPLDWMGAWPWYIVAAEILALGLFSLAWLPFARQAREES